MKVQIPPAALLHLFLWSVLASVVLAFSIAKNLMVHAELVTQSVEQSSEQSSALNADELPPAPSLLTLPFLQSTEAFPSGMLQFLSDFTVQTEDTASSASSLPAAPASLCCNLGTTCNLIGPVYTPEQCVADMGMLEPCVLFCDKDSTAVVAPPVPSALMMPETVAAPLDLPVTVLPMPELCTNGIDDDLDGFIDSTDSDCVAASVSSEVPAQTALDFQPPQLPPFPQTTPAVQEIPGLIPLDDTFASPQLPVVTPNAFTPDLQPQAVAPVAPAFVPQIAVTPDVPAPETQQLTQEQSWWQMMMGLIGVGQQ